MEQQPEPRVNVYRCEFNCLTVTVDVDEGVTPFMIACRSRNRPERPIDKSHLAADGFCRGTAYSSMYPRGPRPPWISSPKWEWYKPTKDDFAEMSRVECVYYRDYPETLRLRERTDAKPIMHQSTFVPLVSP